MRRSPSGLDVPGSRLWTTVGGERRRRHRLRAASAAVAVGLLLGLAACDDEDDPGPSSNGMEPPTASPVASENDLAAIDLGGTEDSPITWRLPTVGTQEEPAVLTARRFLTLDNLLASGDGAELEPLYRAIATDDSLTMRLSTIHAEDPNHGRGPVWIWLQTPQPLPNDELLIRSCRDYGWVDVVGEEESLPRPRGQRADVLELVLRQATVDGVNRWVVTRNHYPQLADQSIAFEKACGQWAQHSTD